MPIESLFFLAITASLLYLLNKENKRNDSLYTKITILDNGIANHVQESERLPDVLYDTAGNKYEKFFYEYGFTYLQESQIS